LLLSWLPVIGDPLCSVAGWLKIPFWPSLAYMALGKLVRYIVVTMLLLAVPDSVWHGLLAVQ
jgi:membrane protein YqaA with SNARE-associated domain